MHNNFDNKILTIFPGSHDMYVSDARCYCIATESRLLSMTSEVSPWTINSADLFICIVYFVYIIKFRLWLRWFSLEGWGVYDPFSLVRKRFWPQCASLHQEEGVWAKKSQLAGFPFPLEIHYHKIFSKEWVKWKRRYHRSNDYDDDTY